MCRGGRASRAPCPPSESIQATPSVVGTAHASLCRRETPYQRRCPPYKYAGGGVTASAPWAAAEALGRSAPELAAFQDEPPQMRSGAVGKAGFLHLGFAHRGRRTILADLDYRIPYRAQRALY